MRSLLPAEVRKLAAAFKAAKMKLPRKGMCVRMAGDTLAGPKRYVRWPNPSVTQACRDHEGIYLIESTTMYAGLGSDTRYVDRRATSRYNNPWRMHDAAVARRARTFRRQAPREIERQITDDRAALITDWREAREMDLDRDAQRHHDLYMQQENANSGWTDADAARWARAEQRARVRAVREAAGVGRKFNPVRLPIYYPGRTVMYPGRR